MSAPSPPSPPAPRREPERLLAALALALLALITLANVAVRYLTDLSFAASEELSVALLVILALLGSAAAVRRGGHLRVTLVLERLPPRARLRLEQGADLATALLFGLLVWYGTLQAWDDYRFGVTSPALGLPQWLYTAWLPLLAAAVTVRAVQRWWGRR